VSVDDPSFRSHDDQEHRITEDVQPQENPPAENNINPPENMPPNENPPEENNINPENMPPNENPQEENNMVPPDLPLPDLKSLSKTDTEVDTSSPEMFESSIPFESQSLFEDSQNLSQKQKAIENKDDNTSKTIKSKKRRREMEEHEEEENPSPKKRKSNESASEE